MSRLSEREAELRLQCATSFKSFAACLSIRTKGRGLRPFVLNRPQRITHALFQRQLKEKGCVRKLILKGRQMGISTYIQGRYYWRVTHKRGAQAYVMAHSRESSNNMWIMLRRFHDTAPSVLRPITRKANARELDFADLQSGYVVGSAGGRDVGRSSTPQFVHCSEVAFYPGDAGVLLLGLLEGVPEPEEGESEVAWESTANGIGGAFHTEWRASEAGESDYERIFLPWFEYEKYRAAPRPGWEAPREFVEYGKEHGLSREQIYWAWRKNRAMAKVVGASIHERCWFFKQEYPATSVEAFQSSGKSFIPGRFVEAARKRRNTPTGGPLVIGVDPAQSEEGEGDATGVIDRDGRTMGRRLYERWFETDTMVIAGRLAAEINRWNPALVVIDTTGGLGKGIYDKLRLDGFERIVRGVVFGAKAIGVGPQPAEQYLNRRAEMWDAMRLWFEDEVGVDIPDDDKIHGDLTAPVWGPGATRFSGERVLQIEPKEKIKARLGRSPDLGDAAALTFAQITPSYAIVDRQDARDAAEPKQYDPFDRYD